MDEKEEIKSLKVELEKLRSENLQLHQTVDNLTLMTNTIKETFWLSDYKNKKLIYVSPSYEKMFGKSIESLFEDPTSWEDNIHPDDRQRIREAFNKKIPQDNYDEEFRIIKNGKIEWIRDRAYPIKDENGEITLITGLSQFITDKQVAEYKLRETTENLIQIMETSPSGILIVNHKFETLYANRYLINLLCLTSSEVFSQNVLKHINEESYDKLIECCKEILSNENCTKHFEFKIKNQEGLEYWVDFKANRIQYNDMNCVLISLNDITKLKKAQETVVASRKNLFALLNNTDYAFILLNRNFQIIDFNLAANRLIENLTSLHLMKRAYYDNYLNEFEQLRFRKEFDKAMNGVGVLNERKLSISGDKTVWVEERYYPAKDEDNEIFGVAYSVIDISERKNAETLLMESKAYLRAIFDSSTELNIFTLDKEYRYTTFNWQHQTKMKMIWNADIKVGENIFTYIDSDNASEKLKDNFDRTFLGEEFTLIEKFKPDDMFFENTYSPIIYKDNIIEGIVVIVRDITDKIKNQKKLENSEKELKELNNSKDKFFSIIAHDLKSPLSGLIGVSHDLSRQVDNLTTDEIKYLAKAMNESAKNIFSLLENLLEWSRTVTGRKEVNKDNMNPNIIAMALLSLFTEVAKNKNIKIHNEFDNKDYLYGDANMFTTILRNLVSNSLKFTQDGDIYIGLVKDGDMGKVYVKDTGVGMSDKIKNKLFRIDENVTELGTNKEKGTGIGLILCKEFVEKNGGKIWVESKLGEGSTFYFTFPFVN